MAPLATFFKRHGTTQRAAPPPCYKLSSTHPPFYPLLSSPQYSGSPILTPFFLIILRCGRAFVAPRQSTAVLAALFTHDLRPPMIRGAIPNTVTESTRLQQKKTKHKQNKARLHQQTKTPEGARKQVDTQKASTLQHGKRQTCEQRHKQTTRQWCKNPGNWQKEARYMDNCFPSSPRLKLFARAMSARHGLHNECRNFLFDCQDYDIVEIGRVDKTQNLNFATCVVSVSTALPTIFNDFPILG